MRTRALLCFALCAPVFGAVVIACGDDPAPEYTVQLAISDTTLNSDGSDGATMSVTVIDADGGPPPLGSTAFIQCQTSGGQPALFFGQSTEAGRGEVALDALGIGSVNVRCNGPADQSYEVQCLAAFEGKSGFLPPFDCNAVQ